MKKFGIIKHYSDSDMHMDSCLGYDAKPLEDSQSLKRSVFNNSGVNSSMVDSGSEKKSKSSFERYLKQKKEIASTKRPKSPNNSPSSLSKGMYRS